MTPLLVIVAGFAAIALGSLLLRSYGPRVRVGRLLAVTPAAGVGEARALAASGARRFVRLDGRLDAEEAFLDEHDRPLVFRRRRLEARSGRAWRLLEERREAVPFRLRDGLEEIGVDADALDDGLVTLVRESVGTAGEVATAPHAEPVTAGGTSVPSNRATVPDASARLASDPATPSQGPLPATLAALPSSTPVRLRIEQLSAVEHASVLGVPVARPDGATVMTAGTGRPLIVSTLERDEAMRVLAEGRRARPVAAATALVGGLILLAVGLAWAAATGGLG